MQSLIEFARFWMLITLAAVCIAGVYYLPCFVWKYCGPVGSGIGLVATAVSVYVIGK